MKKEIITALCALAVPAALAAGLFAWRHCAKYPNRREALEIAIEHAGVKLS